MTPATRSRRLPRWVWVTILGWVVLLAFLVGPAARGEPLLDLQFMTDGRVHTAAFTQEVTR